MKLKKHKFKLINVNDNYLIFKWRCKYCELLVYEVTGDEINLNNYYDEYILCDEYLIKNIIE